MESLMRREHLLSRSTMIQAKRFLPGRHPSEFRPMRTHGQELPMRNHHKRPSDVILIMEARRKAVPYNSQPGSGNREGDICRCQITMT